MVRETCARSFRRARQLHDRAVQNLRVKMRAAVAEEEANHPQRVRGGVDKIVLYVPRGASALFRSRTLADDGKPSKGRRDYHSACMHLLQVYERVAGPPDAHGCRLVSGYTHNYFAKAIGYGVRREQMYHNMLCAMGLVENAGYEDCGDIPKAWVDNKGRQRSVPRRRRCFWLRPARHSELARTVEAVIAGDPPPPAPVAPAAILPLENRSGNLLPTDAERSDLVITDSGSLSTVVEIPECSIGDHRAFDLCASSEEKPLPIDTSLSATTGPSEKVGAATAAPVDRPTLSTQPTSTPNLTASTDRPTAGQRGENSANSGPSAIASPVAAEPVALAYLQLTAAVIAASASPSPDSRPLPNFAVGAPGSPAIASVPRGWPGGPARSSRVPDGQPVPSHAVPYPAAHHKASCDCRPCWISRAVSTGGMPLPPHGRGSECDCVDCLAWRSVRDKFYARFLEEAKRAPSVRWARARRAVPRVDESPPLGRPGLAPPLPSAEPSEAASAARRDWSPLYPDNLSPDDIAIGRAHVELAIKLGRAPEPRPDADGNMPTAVNRHWKKLRFSRRRAQATAYMELYNEALEQLRKARLAGHAADCEGCADCRADVDAEWLKTAPHEPIHPPGKCADCDLWFELLTTKA
jgi:hypothetical protein